MTQLFIAYFNPRLFLYTPSYFYTYVLPCCKLRPGVLRGLNSKALSIQFWILTLNNSSCRFSIFKLSNVNVFRQLIFYHFLFIYLVIYCTVNYMYRPIWDSNCYSCSQSIFYYISWKVFFKCKTYVKPPQCVYCILKYVKLTSFSVTYSYSSVSLLNWIYLFPLYIWCFIWAWNTTSVHIFEIC